jgi:hypothetical protein
MLRMKMMTLMIVAGFATAASAGDKLLPVRGESGDCKVCQPVTETKKVATRVYTKSCEDFCLPRCSFLGGLFCRSNCDECKELKCGPVRTKKYLVVKIRTHEECVTKCVPKPSCETPVPIPPANPLPARPQSRR